MGYILVPYAENNHSSVTTNGYNWYDYIDSGSISHGYIASDSRYVLALLFLREPTPPENVIPRYGFLIVTNRPGQRYYSGVLESGYYATYDLPNSYVYDGRTYYYLTGALSPPSTRTYQLHVGDASIFDNLEAAKPYISTINFEVTTAITYRLTNCTAPSAPTEAAVGDTVNVPFVFPDGYGFPNPATDVYVYNNGVLVPSSYANGVLTFTMPDPS